MAKKMTMYRGDYKTIPVKLPIASYTVGGKLFFGAKSKALVAANDPTDKNAVFPPIVVTTPDSIDATYAYYTIVLTHATTANVAPGTYVAEAQYVNPAGQVVTFSPQFDLVILADIIQSVA